MNQLAIVTSLLLLAGAQGKGQSMLRTGPVTTKDVVSFRLSNMTLENAQTMPVRLRVDSTSQTAPYSTLLPPRTCNRQGNFNVCEAFLPSDAVARINVPGRHLVYAFAFDGNCCESGPSDSWTITTPK